jgi:hypothetical protein
MDEWTAYDDQALARHVEKLGYVPPEFRNHGRFGLDEPPASDASMRRIMPDVEWQDIESAALLAFRIGNGNSPLAESARGRAGYGGLSPHRFIRIPDQRPLLQGGDNDPLD